jgi:putative hemolysin
MRQKNGSIEVRIGSPIQARRLSEFESDHDAMEYLRLHTYVLKKRPPIKENTISPGLPVAAAEPTDGVPIIDPVDPDTLEAEFEALPPEQVMVETDKFKVFLGSKEDIPNAVREIGRLREVTFREVGEGTGREIDLDEFDDIYLHLVLWSRKDREIAGAYRIGRSDRILEKYGKDSLYTNTLFRYKKPFLNFLRKHPALELGRSFITSKYQRSYFPLMLLWKGIGAFVMNNMDYNILYGPVSISSDYNDFSRELMIRFLRLHNRPRSFKKLVKPITPPRIKPSPIAGMITRSAKSLVRDIDDLAALIQEIETDQKGVPVLLRQYLKLGAKLLAFNVDHDFNQCLDGLMLVDLTETDPKILSRYIGSDAAEAFMAHHADKDPGADAQSAMSASA